MKNLFLIFLLMSAQMHSAEGDDYSGDKSADESESELRNRNQYFLIQNPRIVPQIFYDDQIGGHEEQITEGDVITCAFIFIASMLWFEKNKKSDFKRRKKRPAPQSVSVSQLPPKSIVRKRVSGTQIGLSTGLDVLEDSGKKPNMELGVESSGEDLMQAVSSSRFKKITSDTNISKLSNELLEQSPNTQSPLGDSWAVVSK